MLISARTGAVDRSFPDLALNGAVADGHAGWFVAGGALHSGAVTRNGLARLRPDGHLDPGWDAQIPASATVDLLVRSGSRLYAYVTTDEGVNEIQAFGAVSGARLWTVKDIPAQQHFGGHSVLALAASPSVVYVAGDFMSIHGATRRSLAALDARCGHLLTWQAPSPRNGDEQGYFDVLAVVGSRLYVGGAFSAIGGRPRPAIAVLSAHDGTLTSWVPGTVGGFGQGAGAGDVATILVSHGEVLTAGYDGFGVTDAQTGRVLPWMYKLRGVAASFGAAGPIVYLGGGLRNGFNAVSGVARNNLAAINVLTGRFTSWGPNLARYASVGEIVPSGGAVLVSGSFVKSIG